MKRYLIILLVSLITVVGCSNENSENRFSSISEFQEKLEGKYASEKETLEFNKDGQVNFITPSNKIVKTYQVEGFNGDYAKVDFYDNANKKERYYLKFKNNNLIMTKKLGEPSQTLKRIYS